MPMKKILSFILITAAVFMLTGCCAVARLLEDTERCINNTEYNIRKIKKTVTKDCASKAQADSVVYLVGAY